MKWVRHIVVIQLITFLFIVGSTPILYAQKKLFKEWNNPSFSELRIDSDQISKITLRSHPIDKITIYTRMAGETFENGLITVATTESVLSIGTAFTPYFKPYNDKLAAHKVLAIEMIIMVPESLKILIRSRLADVYGSGHFHQLETELELGIVALEFFEGNAILFSKWGSIKVKALPSVSGTARSIYGEVTNSLPMGGIFQIDAASSHGAIVLSQTKK